MELTQAQIAVLAEIADRELAARAAETEAKVNAHGTYTILSTNYGVPDPEAPNDRAKDRVTVHARMTVNGAHIDETFVVPPNPLPIALTDDLAHHLAKPQILDAIARHETRLLGE